LPGNARFKNNPTLTAVKNASVVENFYSCTYADGSVDVDGPEKLLRDKENIHAPILRRFQGMQPLSDEDFVEFTKYMILLHQRSVQHMRTLRESFSELINDEEYVTRTKAKVLTKYRADRGDEVSQDESKAAELIADLIVQNYQRKMPDHLRIGAVFFDLPRVSQTLHSMRWTVWMAPPSCFFVAADSPVNLRSGFERKDAEILFPLSSKMLLVATFPADYSFRYEMAAPYQVDKANWAMCRHAHDEVYAPRASDLIAGYMRR
jgi:hypothetical protein